MQLNSDVRCLPVLLPHLFKGVGDIKSTDLLVILKFKKFVPPMPRHIHEDIATLIREQSLGSRYRCLNSPLDHNGPFQDKRWEASRREMGTCLSRRG